MINLRLIRGAFMPKRGQFIGQVFVYVLMVIVFAGVLLFGFNAIKNLMSRGSQIELKNFEIELKKLVDSNMHYLSSEIKTLTIPGEYKEICFIDRCAYDDTCSVDTIGLDESNWNNKYGVDPNAVGGYAHSSIKDSLEGGSKNNIYLYPKQKDDEFKVGALQVYHQCEVYLGPCPDYNSMFSGTPTYAHFDTAAHKNFICMPVIDGKVRIRMKGLGNRVEVVQLPLI